MLLLLLLICFVPYIIPYNINVGSTGLLFPYTLGALAYIKTCIKPEMYKLTSVSGGTWCSLIYHFEKNISDHDALWDILVGNQSYSVHLLNRRSMSSFQQLVSENFKKRYRHENVSNVPISILTTELKGLRMKSTAIDSFQNMNELVDYCLCSSYIPFISGNKFKMLYNNKYYMDGEIFKNKKLLLKDPVLNLHKGTWNRKFALRDYMYLDFNRSKVLFNYGWQDAKKHL